MAVLLDLLRLFAGVAILSFAAYTDWMWRRAPNVLWLLLAGIGAVVLAADVALDPSGVRARWPYLVAIPLFAGLMYGFWWLGLIAGGADAKALMALALLLPFPIALTGALPLWGAPVPGAFTVLGDSLVLFLVIPLSLFVWNVSHGDARLPHAFLGIKKEGASIRRGHHWPMETFDAEGTRKTRLFASRMSASEVDETFERLAALGSEKVWVTPKIPFMIPLLLGFVAAFTVGDLLFGAMTALIQR